MSVLGQRHRVRICVPGDVVPWARARSNGSRRFTARPQAIYKQKLQIAARKSMAGRPPLEGPLRFELYVTRTVPKGWSKMFRDAALAGHRYPLTRPDLDNYSKLKDAFDGIVWIDDAQVCDERCLKQYGEAASLVAIVEQMT